MTGPLEKAEAAHDAVVKLLKALGSEPIWTWVNNKACPDATTEAHRRANTALIDLRHNLVDDLRLLRTRGESHFIAVGHEPGAIDPWTIYWSDGQQVAGATFSDTGTKYASIDGGPGHDVDPTLFIEDVPAAVLESAQAAMQAWDATAEALP